MLLDKNALSQLTALMVKDVSEVHAPTHRPQSNIYLVKHLARVTPNALIARNVSEASVVILKPLKILTMA